MHAFGIVTSGNTLPCDFIFNLTKMPGVSVEWKSMDVLYVMLK